MGFAGNLKTIHLAEILQWCRNGRKTGVLTLSREGIRKEIFVEEGRIVSASSNDPHEHLGHFLVSLGKITGEQLDLAVDIQNRTGVLLGRVLVARRFISDEGLEEVLRLKITETIFNLFLWKDGDFQFRKKTLSTKNRRVDVQMDVEKCIMEGARRVDEWKRFRAVFPRDKMVPVPGEKPPGTLADPLARRLAALVAQGKSIEEMCLETCTHIFTVLAALFDLYQRGYVAAPKKVKKEDAVPAAAAACAKTFASEEEEVNCLYDECLPPAGVPRLLKGEHEMEDLSLSFKESFVLPRINGVWDVRSIVGVCPLREVETLRALKRFLDEGMIVIPRGR